MALIKCPECGKEVSDKAEKCIHCGCPLDVKETEKSDVTVESDDVINADKDKIIKKKKQWNKKIILISGSIVAFVLVGVFVYYIATAKSREYKSAKELFDAKQYEESYAVFTEISEYKDSMDMANECLYQMAQSYYAEKKYESAKELFDKVDSYKDSSDMSKECLYLKAQNLFENENYKEALECFKQLDTYKNSADMLSQCEYNMTVDGQFIKALSKGLMHRWDISEQDGVEDMSDTEYSNYLRDCVNSELPLLQKFKEETFEDPSLQEKAIEYIESLEKSLSAIDYYSMNYDKYSSIWDEVYAARTKLLRDFFNDYNLVVDEAYEDTKNKFLTNATVVEENEALEASIVEMMNQFTIDKVIEDYGGITATVTMVNTTDKTFEYFGCDMEFLDENDTIVYTTYTGEVKNFKPGQKASLEVYCGENDFESVIYHANYNVKE